MGEDIRRHRVQGDGSVTIPAALREKYGLDPGETEVAIRETDDGTIEIIPASQG